MIIPSDSACSNIFAQFLINIIPNNKLLLTSRIYDA